MNLLIRPINPDDNPAVKRLIVDTLVEFGCIGPGYASEDAELDDMFSAYRQTDGAFFVIEDTESMAVLGTGGFSRLKGTEPEDSICEFQKFYFRPALRGKGMGRQLISFVMRKAQAAGYREVYLETVPQMQAAIGLYRKMGFALLDSHRGATGHHERCPIRMARPLSDLSDIAEPAETLVSTG